MSEVIVAKAGGTSNADAVAVEQSLVWANQADIFVVSAPGKPTGSKEPKVTDLLLDAHDLYVAEGAIPFAITDTITARYDAIAKGLGNSKLTGHWIDAIRPRIVEAAYHSKDATSMLGERLQAEIYQSLGFLLLDPGRSKGDLGNDPDAWRGWLSNEFVSGKRYVLPGNTTKENGQLVTFDRGGSDISGGLAAYGINADLNLNLTNGSAMSADPELVVATRLKPIEHMLYVEGRELGRNGTGLVHAAAMVPLMRGNIPTEIRSTFDPAEAPTTLDNNYQRAAMRQGRIIALSLMKDVVIHKVYEPGMAEATGRLAEFDSSLATHGVTLIDSQGDGVDGQKYFLEAEHSGAALAALKALVTHGTVETKSNVDMITMVGYELNLRLIDNMVDLIFNSGIGAKDWQRQGHDLSHGRHSLRISLDSTDSERVFNRLHAHFLEQ